MIAAFLPVECVRPWCGRTDEHGERDCRARMLRDVVPKGWAGEYHVHLGGKSGELLFFSGCLPAIRRALPFARIVLHIHPHYARIVPGLEHRPDGYVCDPWYSKFTAAPLQDQVVHGLRHAIASLGRGARTLTLLGDEKLATCVYLRSQGGRRPFYEMFMDCCGVGDGVERWSYEPPRWGGPVVAESPIALVLASANSHAGGGVRQIDCTPGDWLALAKLAAARGWAPLATGHMDDPRPEMPGWGWVSADDPFDVFRLLQRSVRVIGFNSGMTFAATRLVPPGGKVTMIDGHGLGIYDFGNMAGVVAPEHVQIPLQVARDRTWRAVLEEALT